MLVTEKSSGTKYHVHDIIYNKAGYPQFLIYTEGQWVRRSAKYFKPDVDFEEMMDGIRGVNRE